MPIHTAFSANFFESSFMWGMDATHGPHHVAQKSITRSFLSTAGCVVIHSCGAKAIMRWPRRSFAASTGFENVGNVVGAAAAVPVAAPPALAPASDGAIFSVSKNAHARFIPLGVSPAKRMLPRLSTTMLVGLVGKPSSVLHAPSGSSAIRSGAFFSSCFLVFSASAVDIITTNFTSGGRSFFNFSEAFKPVDLSSAL